MLGYFVALQLLGLLLLANDGRQFKEVPFPNPELNKLEQF
jgi:hypothetical protein